MNVYIPGTGFATQGPCPDGFHVPLKDEWQGLRTIMVGLGLTTGDNWRINLHMPFVGTRGYSNSGIVSQGEYGSYWSSSPYDSDSYSYFLTMNSYNSYVSQGIISYGNSIRGFKNLFVVPTSSWTVIQGTLGSAGIFWNQSDGLISITSDGTTGYTIQDKNLGATTVYNNGDTLTQANMGNMYQWGNNYGFPSTGTISKKSSTQVNASNYGPGNYYESDTFIVRSGSLYGWDSSNNKNLRGGEDGNVQVMSVLKNAYIGEVWTPGSNTVCYYPFDTDILDATGNTTISGSLTKDGLGYRPTSYGNIPYPTGNYPLFLNYRLLIKQRPSSSTGAPSLDNPSTGYYPYHSNSSLNKKIWTFYNSSYASATVSFSPKLNTWHNISVGYDGTKMIYSIDGVSGTLYNGRGYNFGDKIGWGADSGQYIISNLIAEKTVWTAQEISNYYNNTKSNYGL